jgi:imidazolonepropionase
MLCDRIWTDARLMTMIRGLGIVEDGLVAASSGRIVYAGPRSGAPSFVAKEQFDLQGRWVTPGLIDCHTHLIHGGDRAHEFEMRLAGATYEEIARAGGGIRSTVNATRATSEEDLMLTGFRRLDALIAEGVTTIEIKSGYGLEGDTELRQLRAAERLMQHRRIDVRTTFLGAHAIPPEYTNNRAGYVDRVCEWIPRIAADQLAEAVDVFCERIAFTPEETDRIFTVATANGLHCKLHADQLSNTGGAALAAKHRALSADHLEHTDEAGVQAMAAAGTVAVMLPGAFYFLRETVAPPVALFRKHGVPMAVATDCNPGSSPLTSILLAMNMAATLFRLTVEECLTGVTRVAAQALGLNDRGTLEAGKWCDLAVWDIERPAELVYRIGFNPLVHRIWRGE